MKKYVFILFLFLFTKGLDAQINKGAYILAQEYLAQENYAQALSYLVELYQKNPSIETLENIKLCYVKTKQLPEAEKFIKKAVRTFKSNPFPSLWLGEIALLNKNTEEAAKQFNKGIQISFHNFEVDPDKVASFLIGIQQYKLAFDIYAQLRKQYKDPFAYAQEISLIYRQLGDKQGLFREILSPLAFQNAENNTVKQKLYNDLTEEKDYTLLQEILIDAINQNPDNPAYADVLIWLLVQQNKFTEALFQAKAVDKRMNSKGEKLFDLGTYAYANFQLKEATEAFNLVLAYGESSRYYYPAFGKILEVYYDAFESYQGIDTALALSRFDQYLSNKQQYNSFETLDRYIRILVYHTHKAQNALDYIGAYLATNRLNNAQLAVLKLLQSDALVFLGDTYEALLLCGQVELDFKDHPLGQEAKFKSAKINYYNGDFDWAKAQLDVLKGSTTQLYANDALNLSLLISENSSTDSLSKALLFFAEAELLLLQNKLEEAYNVFAKIQKEYPGDALNDDILMAKGRKLVEMNQKQEAIPFFERIVETYDYDIWADDALFALAEIYSELGETEKAMSYYQKIIEAYPSSLFVIPSRTKYLALKAKA